MVLLLRTRLNVHFIGDKKSADCEKSAKISVTDLISMEKSAVGSDGNNGYSAVILPLFDILNLFADFFEFGFNDNDHMGYFT